jgi:hypothetical protein
MAYGKFKAAQYPQMAYDELAPPLASSAKKERLFHSQISWKVHPSPPKGCKKLVEEKSP